MVEAESEVCFHAHFDGACSGATLWWLVLLVFRYIKACSRCVLAGFPLEGSMVLNS